MGPLPCCFYKRGRGFGARECSPHPKQFFVRLAPNCLAVMGQVLPPPLLLLLPGPHRYVRGHEAQHQRATRPLDGTAMAGSASSGNSGGIASSSNTTTTSSSSSSSARSLT